MEDTRKYAAIYTRVSLDATGEHEAVGRQLADCRKMAKDRGWKIVGEYEDNSISASDSKKVRPAYNRMIADFEAGKFGALVCWDLDRLTRQPRQLEDWIERATKQNLLLVTANGEADLTNDNGITFAGIKAQVARGEVLRKGARQRRANLERMTTGAVYGRRHTWGWTDLKCETLDPVAADIIQKAAVAILQGATTREVAQDWNTRGILAPGTKKTGPQPWLSTTVRTTMLRPVNAGLATYHGAELRDVEAKWTPIFDMQTYDALVATLKQRGSYDGQPVRRATKYLLRNLLKCGVCGSTMQGSTQKSGVNYPCSGREHGCYRAIRVEKADAVAIRFAAMQLAFRNESDYLTPAQLSRKAAISRLFLRIEKDRARVRADTRVLMASKLALIADLDAEDTQLRAELAQITKDSVIASLLDAISPGIPIDGKMDLRQRQWDIVHRIEELTITQQRLVIKELVDITVYPPSHKPRFGLQSPRWPTAEVPGQLQTTLA